jgi:hypothetical protein
MGLKTTYGATCRRPRLPHPLRIAFPFPTETPNRVEQPSNPNRRAQSHRRALGAAVAPGAGGGAPLRLARALTGPHESAKLPRSRVPRNLDRLALLSPGKSATAVAPFPGLESASTRVSQGGRDLPSISWRTQ